MIEYENLAKVNKPYISEYLNSYIEILNKGWFILGEHVRKFENELSRYIGTKYCVGVASGLDALIIGLRSLNLEPLSEVLVPSNTYIASIMAIVHAGLIPVLVEPNINTYNIDPFLIERKITKKTSAIMVVHLYGKACEMDPILEICKSYKLKLIEDCAQAHGAMYKEINVGNFGDVSAFSFYPTKNLGALGDGGAVLTNNFKYYDKIIQYRNYGSKIKYYNELVGYNSRLDEIQAGILLVKMKYLDEINKHKRMLAKLYLDNLDPQYILPVVDNNFYDIHHIFPIRHKKRDDLKRYLSENSIGTEIHYPVPPRKQKAMKGIIDKQKSPIADIIHSTILSLPISSFHNPRHIMKVIEVLNKYK